MVTRTEVEFAYRLILGREPESLEVIMAHAKAHRTVEELRRTLIHSPEFEAGYSSERDRLAMRRMRAYAGGQESPTIATAAELQQLISRVEQEFTYLGETEPYWSVLTSNEFKLKNIEATKSEFYASG